MTPAVPLAPPTRVVVCGATFGRAYVDAVLRDPARFTLAGVLGRGGSSSRAAAEHAGVPWWTDVDQVPDDVDVAAVVVRSGVVGGQGTELARALLARGVHVVQEQPLHHDEVAGNLRAARGGGATFVLGDPYPHLPAVRRFVAAAAAARAADDIVFVDAACAVQVAFPLLHVLGAALGSLRPWRFGAPAEPVHPDDPLRVMSGQLGGVPLSLRVQTEMDADDPDNHLLRLITITIGTTAGNLTLLDAHGPVVWSPRLHVPRAVRLAGRFDDEEAAHLGMPAATLLDAADSATQRDLLATHFPDALAAVLGTLRPDSATPPEAGARLLAACRAWHDLTERLGYPRLRPHPTPVPRPAAALRAAADAADPR
ncbi:Gfo/Idh/MocA family oxidoreductase [Pseudonocardia sp. NPDC046786]|uniref:Gfo/Idh/MocA family oxidoreductase n=1 Tax=Pseudonocardia sp. NPDC046786 TaxID=3155471 RepID=UPI0033E0949F